MMQVDAHSHLHFLPLNQVREVLVKSRFQHRVLGGYGPFEWPHQKQLRTDFPQKLSCGLGLHPWLVCESSENELESLWQQWLQFSSEADWLGECGLDVSKKPFKARIDVQKEFFRRQLKVASSAGKPVILHAVGAWGEMLELLDQNPVRGFVHAFSGSQEVANEFLKRNIKISIGPQVLNPKFVHLRKTVAAIEVKHFLVETDSPSGRTQPEYLGDSTIEKICKEIAQIQTIPVAEVQSQVYKNFFEVYKG